MSCKGSCSKTSNNKHFNCPPRMDDGRHFTDYRPNCHINNLIQNNNSLHSSFQTRNFLTQNAMKLMELNREEACSANCCGPCQKPYQIGTTLPEKSAEIMGGPVPCGQKESQLPLINSYNGKPLGCSSWNVGDSKRTQNCCTPSLEAVNYYQFEKDNINVTRKAVPGGGIPLKGGDPNMYN